MPAPGSTNITAEFYERPYNAARETTIPPYWFVHVAVASAPSAPTFPGTLSAKAQLQVNAWLGADATTRTHLYARLTTERDALAKIAEYITFYASEAYVEWIAAENASRIAQWRLYMADAMIANKDTEAGSTTGPTGGTAPTFPIAHATNTPT